jgi:hypothetical protein
MWLFLNWFSEAIQKDPSRIIPRPAVVWTPFFLSLLLCAREGTGAVVFLIVFTLTIAAYPWKAKSPVLGPLGPILRGITILTHALLIIAYVDGFRRLSCDAMYVVGFLALLHVARNLVGDIRDMEKDQYELPARFGFRVSYNVVRVILGSSLVVAWFTNVFYPALVVPLIVQWLGLEFLAVAYRGNNTHLVGYVGHRLFVITYTCAQIGVCKSVGIAPSTCWVLSAILVCLQLSYRHTPGKTYPAWKEVFSQAFLPAT